MVEQTRVHQSPVEFTVIPPESGGVHCYSTGVWWSSMAFHWNPPEYSGV